MGLLPELDKVITLPKLEFILPQTQISELHVPCADYKLKICCSFIIIIFIILVKDMRRVGIFGVYAEIKGLSAAS